MIKATTNYCRWEEVPYETQLRLIRALASVAKQHSTIIRLHDCSYGIESIYECVDGELDAYKGKD